MAGQVVVREYKSRADFERDANRMAGEGYEVVSTTDRPQRSGCLRLILTGGLGFIFWKPKPKLAVTYRKRA